MSWKSRHKRTQVLVEFDEEEGIKAKTSVPLTL